MARQVRTKGRLTLRRPFSRQRVACYTGDMRTKIASGWNAAKLEAWQKRCGFANAIEAAAEIGVSRAQYYKMAGGEQAISLTVELACRAVEALRTGKPIR